MGFGVLGGLGTWFELILGRQMLELKTGVSEYVDDCSQIPIGYGVNGGLPIICQESENGTW